jgi:hypothetical protein
MIEAIKKLWRSLTALFTSEDGGLSFSKLLTMWVAVMYSIGREVPVAIAILLVVSAHGTKVLIAWVQSKAVVTTETVSSRTEGTPPAIKTEATKTTVKEPVIPKVDGESKTVTTAPAPLADIAESDRPIVDDNDDGVM